MSHAYTGPVEVDGGIGLTLGNVHIHDTESAEWSADLLQPDPSATGSLDPGRVTVRLLMGDADDLVAEASITGGTGEPLHLIGKTAFCPI